MFDAKTAVQNLDNKLHSMGDGERDAYLRRMGLQTEKGVAARRKQTVLQPKRHIRSLSLYQGK